MSKTIIKQWFVSTVVFIAFVALLYLMVIHIEIVGAILTFSICILLIALIKVMIFENRNNKNE